LETTFQNPDDAGPAAMFDGFTARTADSAMPRLEQLFRPPIRRLAVLVFVPGGALIAGVAAVTLAGSPTRFAPASLEAAMSANRL
jgi:hypothetical protein